MYELCDCLHESHKTGCNFVTTYYLQFFSFSSLKIAWLHLNPLIFLWLNITRQMFIRLWVLNGIWKGMNTVKEIKLNIYLCLTFSSQSLLDQDAIQYWPLYLRCVYLKKKKLKRKWQIEHFELHIHEKLHNLPVQIFSLSCYYIIYLMVCLKHIHIIEKTNKQTNKQINKQTNK